LPFDDVQVVELSVVTLLPVVLGARHGGEALVGCTWRRESSSM